MKIFNIQSKGLRAALATAMAFCLLATCMLTNMIGVFTVGAATDNLIKNGDFESGSLNNWSNEWGLTASAVKNPHGGTYAMSMTGNTWNAMAQEVAVEKNTFYTISFWSKRTAGTGKHVLWVKDAANSKNVAEVRYNSDEWAQTTMSFNTGDNEKIYVRFGIDDGGGNTTTNLIDDVMLVKEKKPSFDGILYDGNFESGKMLVWENQSANSVITDAAAHTGKYSMLLKENAGSWKATMQRIKLQKNTNYIITFWAKAASKAGDVVYLWMQEGDTGDNSSVQPGKMDITLTADWKQYTLKMNSGNYEKFLVRFGLGSDPTQQAYIDDVKIRVDGNLVANGDFETGAYAPEWTKAASLTASVEGDASNHYLKFNGNAWSFMKQKITVKKNTSYTVSAKGMRASGSGDCVLYVKSADDSKNLASSYFNGSSFETKSATFNSGDNEYIWVNPTINDNGATGVFYMDDIVLEEDPVASTDGILTNGDFETGKMSPWENQSANSEITDLDAHSGNYSLWLKENAGSWKATMERVKLKKNTNYVITFWAKAASKANDVVYLWVQEGDTGDNSSTQPCKLDIKLTDEWTQYTGKWNSGNYEKYLIRFGLGSDPTQQAYIDDVKIEEDSNLIVNGDFESKNVNGWINEWSNTASAVEGGHNGGYAMSLKCSAQYSSMVQKPTLKANTWYTLSFWTKRVSGDGAHSVWIKTNGNNWASDWFNKNGADWEQSTVTFNTGANTSFEFRFGADSGVNAVYYYDDITLVEEDVKLDGGMLYDGTFESGKMIAWENVSAHSEYTKADKHAGEYSLLLKENEGAWKATAQKVTLVPNTTYEVTFWAKAVNADSKGKCVYLWVNECETQADGGGKVGNYDISLTDEWKEHKVKFTADATHTKYLFRFGLGDNTAVKAYIDDVKLIKEPNLIVNGEFETGNMTGWNKNSCTASAVTTPHTGSYAMSVTGGQWAAVNQEVAVEKNSFYTISFWSKRISGTGKHVLWVKDGSGNLAEVRYDSDEWKETSISFFTGNNDKIDVRFGIDAGGNTTTNLIDDVKMVKEDIAQDGGMLFDGGFESGKMIAWNNISAHSEFTTADKHSGTHSLLLKEDSGAWKATAQAVTLKKNATYRATFWAKAASAPAGTVYLWVNECETQADGGGKVGNLDIALTDAWKEYTVDFQADATHTKYLFRFGLGGDTAVKAYIDDVKLEELKTSSDDGILLNYDFENGIADWTLFSATTNTSTAATTAHAGTGSMHLSGSQWSAIEQTTKTLKKNTYYNVSFWAKRDAGTGVAHLWVNGKGSDDKLDGFDIAIKPASGDGWVKYQKVVNTGKYDGLRVRFGIEDTASTFFIDDVKIEEVTSDGYIVNGSFEFGTAGWEVGNMTAADSRASQEGANALQITTNTMWASLIQTVNVKKNTDYKVVFWSKTNGATATKQSLIVKTAGDTEMKKLAFNDSGVVADYTKYEMVFNSGENEKVKICFVGFSDSSKYYLDNVSMFEFVEPSDDGFIKNGDFETGTLDPWLNQWELTPEIVTDAAQGKYALKVSNGKESNQWSAMQISFSADKNTTYRVSYDVKVESGNCALYIKDGNTQLDSADMKGSSWNHVEKEFNTGDHSHIDLRFSFATAKAVYYLDNVKVEKVTQKDDGFIKNGDFESGKVSPWYAEWGSSTISLITENTYEGNYAMKGTTTKQWAQVMQTINVKKNTDYILSYYSKEAVGDARLWIKGNGDGNNIQEALLNTTSDWKQTVVEFNSGNFDKVDIRYGVNDAAGGSYCIDDVYVREKGAELFDGVVYNGDFEKDMTHWTNEWAHSEITTEAVHGGSKALLLKQNDTAWQATMQKIKLEKNTQYMLRFYAKAKSGSQMYLWMNSTDGHDTKVVDKSLNPGADWTLYEIDFNSGEYTELKLRFGLGDGGNASAQIYIDDVSVKKYVKPVVKARPLTSFGVAANCPKDDSVNLIKNGGFEATTDAQWASLIGKDGLSIVGAPKVIGGASNVHSGASALLFDTTGAKSNIRTYFKVKVEKNTEYVFSAWMKGPFLSADNHGLNTIGLADPTTGKFLVLTKSGWQQGHSTENKQLVPPAWDNEWHLRSVSFNSGETEEVAIAFYGIGSKLYVDDIALYKSDDGMMYSDARMTSIVKTTFDFEQANCESKDNLVKNGDFSEGAKEWEDGLGAANEFVSIRESEYEYGDALLYKASENPVGVSYIKWIDVEPNTNYIFSADVRILESGRGYIGLLDDRYTSPRTFYASEFDAETYGEDWFKTAIKFNTSVFTRIGIVISDQGGEALIDNIRLFKAENAADVEDKFIPIPDEPDQPDNPDNPDGPKTGDPMALVVAAIAIALAAVMTTVFFRKARRA